jgi:anti-anti-sigma regulatory factor
VPNGYKFLLLNFSNVEFFGPPDVIGKLVRLKKRIAAVGGKLKLCCINPGMLEVLTGDRAGIAASAYRIISLRLE